MRRINLRVPTVLAAVRFDRTGTNQQARGARQTDYVLYIINASSRGV